MKIVDLITRRIREKTLRWRIKWAVGLLRSISSNMKRLGWSRQRRRAFWRDFSRSPELQEEIFNGLMERNR